MDDDTGDDDEHMQHELQLDEEDVNHSHWAHNQRSNGNHVEDYCKKVLI